MMRIGLYGNILSQSDGRGIVRSISVLFSKINELYPNIEIYVLNNNTVEKFIDKYTLIPCNIENIKKYNLDYLIFPSNGHGIKYYKDLSYKTKIVSLIHDIIPVLISDNKEEVSDNRSKYNLDYLNHYQEVIDYSDIIMAISEHSKKDLLSFLTVIRPINVIYLSHMLFKTKEKPPVPTPFFLYNGGYDYRKGILQMLENFLQLKLRDKIKSSLVLTGNKLSRPLINNISKVNFLINYGKKNGWIIDLGYVTDEELSSLYSNATAMVYPSSYEGFGLPLVEAMYLGCPIITTNVSSIPEICGDATYYIDRNNEDEFQKAFIELEQNSNLRNSLIKKGLENIKRFSWEKSVHQFVNLLKHSL